MAKSGSNTDHEGKNVYEHIISSFSDGEFGKEGDDYLDEKLDGKELPTLPKVGSTPLSQISPTLQPQERKRNLRVKIQVETESDGEDSNSEERGSSPKQQSNNNLSVQTPSIFNHRRAYMSNTVVQLKNNRKTTI